MSLTQCEVNTNIIENLPDSPNLSPEELKRKFDESGSNLKEYINEILISEVETLIATEKKNLQTTIANEKKNLLASISEQILEDNKKKYYVGKIIIDTKNVNPATYLGFGTWQLWGSGRVPVGVDTSDSNFNTVEKTGGSNTHNHNSGKTGGPSNNTTGSTALTINQIPVHHHRFADYIVATGAGGTYTVPCISKATTAGSATQNTGGGQGHTHTLNNHTHSITAGSNIQKYITCYMWKRTS